MKQIQLTLLSVCFCVAATAQTQLSLDDAISRALENNFQIQIAELSAEIQANNNTWGQTNAVPVIGLTGSFSNNISDQSQHPTAFIQDKLESTTLQYGANLNWTLFDGFGMFAAKRQLEILEEQSEGNAALVIENTLQAIIISYYQAALQQAKLEVLSDVIHLSEDRLNYMQVKQELGASTTFEILQFENAIIADSTNYLMQELAARNAQRNLNLLMAESEDIQWELTTGLGDPAAVFVIEDLQSRMRSSNQQMKNQYLNLRLIEEDVNRARSSLYPVVSFQAGINQADSRFKVGELEGDGTTLNYFGNFVLNFNLFNGGKARRSLQNAKIQTEISSLGLADLELRLDAELRTTYERYQAQQRIFGMSNRNVSNAKRTMEIANDRFQNGVINSFDYRDVQLVYLNASTLQLENLYNLLATHTGLVRLTGGLVRAK
jgi:outer membrane protein